MIRKLAVIGVSCLVLSGCFAAKNAQSPIATTFPLTEQQKMQSAHHWDVLANYEAAAVAGSSELQGIPLFVGNGRDNSSFNDTFKSLLVSGLIKQGVRVNASEAGAAKVTYDVSVVEHTDQDLNRAPFGQWTALAAGVAVATIPFNNWSEPALSLIPAAMYVDVFGGSWTDESGVEVVITTQVVLNDEIKYSSSNIYYVNGEDSGNYKKSKNISLTNQW